MPERFRHQRRSSRSPLMAEMKPQVYKDPRPAEYFHAVPRVRPQRLDLDLHAGPHRPHPADDPDLPRPRDRARERAAPGRLRPRPQPLQPDGPLLRRRLPAAEDPLHGQIAALRAAGPDLHLQARRRLPGPPRPPRRGGLQDRLRRCSTRARCCSSTPRAGARARSELGEPKPGIGRIALESGAPIVPVAIHGSAGVRGWKRLRFPKVTVQFGEPLSFPVEAATRAASASWRSATEVFADVREMYEELATRSGAGSGSRTPDRARA